MACNDLQIVQTTPDTKVLHSKDEVKQTRYDASVIKDSMLHTLLTGSKTEVSEMWESLFGDKGLLSGFRSVRDKTRALRKYFKTEPLGAKIGDLSEGEARPIAIALNHLMAVQKSEEDLITKYKLTKEEIAQVTDMDNDMENQYNTSYSNMARTIGRDILKSRGYRLIPKTKKGVTLAIEQEIKEGEKALEMLNKRGLLSINEDGSIINRHFRKSDGSPDMFSADRKEDKATPLVSNIKTVTLKDLFPEDIYKNSAERLKDMELSLGKIKAVNKLVLPSNSSIPHSEAQPINEAIQDMENTKATREVIEQVQQAPLKIQGMFGEALKELKDLVDKSDTYQTTNDYLMSLTKYVNGTRASKFVFGTVDTANMYDAYTDDMTGINQQYGKSISKTLGFTKMFDDFDSLIDSELYFTYQTAKQNRLFVFEQTLNYQTDNFLARPILGSPEVQTLGKEEIDYMLGYLIDETGLTMEEILGTGKSTTKSALVDKYIKSLSNTKASKLGVILTIGKDMEKGVSPIPIGKVKSAWDVANYMNAINDIRKGYKDGQVKTHFLVKPDATASGALITVLQASGRTANAAEVTKELVLGKRVFDKGTETEIEKDFTDMYELSTFELKKRLDASKEKVGDEMDALAARNNPALDLMHKIIDPDTGVINGARDLMKLPFTKFIYGQAAYNNKLEISKEITSEIIDTNNVGLMKAILNTKPDEELPTGSELRIKLIAKLVEKKGVADELVSIVEETTGEQLFKEQSEELEAIHELLEAARFSEGTQYDQIQIVPPLAALEAENINDTINYENIRSDFGTTIEKWNEAVVETGDATLTTIKKHFPNMNSIKVLLQHMTDAAILVKAMEAVYTKPEFKDYKNGLMLNHDSVGSTAAFAIALEVEYKKQIMEVNKNYDFVEAAYRELKYAKDRVNDPVLKAKMEDKIAKLESELPAIISKKQAAIGNEVIETSFGIKPKVKKLVAESNLESDVTAKVTEDSNAKQEVTTSNKKTFTQKEMKQSIVNTLNTFQNTPLGKIGLVALSKNPDVNIVIDEKYNDNNHYDLASNTLYFGSKGSKEILVHELVHAATAQAIETDPKFAAKVRELYETAKKAKKQFTRISATKHVDGVTTNIYVNFMDKFEAMDEADVLHEFMATTLTNPEMVKELSKVSFGRKLINKIKETILGLLGLDEKTYNTVYGQMLETFTAAKYDGDKASPAKTLNFIDVLNETYTPYSPDLDKKTEGVDKVTQPIADTFVNLDAKMAKLIQSSLDASIDFTANKLKGKDYHDKMMKKSRIYRDTFNAVQRQWDENTLIGKLKIYMNLDDNFDYKAMNKVITQSLHAEERKAELEQKEINKLQKSMKKLFNASETAQMHALLSETPLFNLEPKMIQDILTGTITIDQAIDTIKSNPKLNKNQLKNADTIAEGLAEFYINKVPPKTGFKTDLKLPKGIKDTTSKLSALYAMKKIKDVDVLLADINGNKAKQELFSELLDISIANKTLDNELDSTISYEIDKHSGNLNHMVFETNNEIKVVTTRNINQVMANGLGWKILRKPTKTQAGIVYRDAGDISYQGGAGVNLKTDPNIDLRLPSEFEASTNTAVNNSGSRAKIILKNHELDTLGYVRNPVYSLVKGHTHRMMLLETQAIREEVVNKFTYSDKTKPTKIEKDIKTGKHLWYIKLPKGTTLADMPELVQKKYTASSAKSDVAGFEGEVTLVRKDIKDFIEGYKEIQIGETGTTLNKAFNILKKSILLQKIHWVITAPTKIARDAISNVSYLMSRNVPVNVIYSKTKRVMNEMTELNQLREELLHAEFKNRVKTTPAMVARIAKLENDIKIHPLAAAHFNGFIQSLAIELSSKNEHTISGLHKDISTLLDYLFKDDKDALNIAGNAIMKMSKFGINGEDLLIAVANKFGSKAKSSSTKAMAASLKEMGEHIKDIKEEEDISAYVQEFLGTPGTSMVAIGSAAVQAVDVVAKVIDYEHIMDSKVKKFNKDNGRKPSKTELTSMSEDAAQEALENFIDYKVNIPREFRLLEQTGITSFISFTSRIQRIMFRSLRNNPVNAMFTILFNDLLNLEGGSTIFDANIFERDIIRTPSFGMDVIFPTKVFG